MTTPDKNGNAEKYSGPLCKVLNLAQIRFTFGKFQQRDFPYCCLSLILKERGSALLRHFAARGILLVDQTPAIGCVGGAGLGVGGSG